MSKEHRKTNEQEVHGIIQARLRKGWTQAHLAEHMGVATKTVARWEAGATIPQPELRAKLGALLQIDPEELWPFQAPLSEPASQQSQRVDWGEAPHLDRLYGRDQELATLRQWITEDSCHLVAILGVGGIGKTSLAATVANQVHEHYDFVFWRSLHNALPFKYLVEECIQIVSKPRQTVFPEETDDYISLLIDFFRTSRCLIVLDNVESILREGNPIGQYRDGCEGYGRLFQRVGESKHRSCLLLTSREKPPEVAFLEGETVMARSLHLGGLEPGDGQDVLKDKGLQGTEDDWEVLINHYGGNPLALKLVAQMIREVFDGKIAAFLVDGELFFRDVRDVLEQQMQRLSALEEEIVYWFAIEREAITFTDLRENIIHVVPKGEFQEALRSLRRRHLIETRMNRLALHPVILEYLTGRFVDRVSEEIRTQRLVLFERHALLKAQTKEYLRQSQCSLIVLPLLQQLLTIFEKKVLEQRLQSLLATLRAKPDRYPGYAGGNVLNLLIQGGWTLYGYDFSHLVVRQAYLQGVALPGVNFASADLTTSVFTDTFGNIHCVAFSPQGDLLAGGATTGEIRVWDASSGLPLRTFWGHTDWVNSVAFSPDGKMLASGSHDQTVRLWEVSSGICLKILHSHGHVIWSVAFSPDGKMLASGGGNQTPRLWEVSSGICLHILQGHAQTVWSVAFSPDGKMLASGSGDQTVRLWEVSSGVCLSTLHGHSDWVNSVAFSPDGKMLASGGNDRAVRLWEVNSGICLHILQGHTGMLRSVAFSPDGKMLASGGNDQTAHMWEVNSGICLHILQGHTGMLRSVAFSPDGKMLASGGDDRTVRLWEVNSGICLHILQGHAQEVWSVAFSPDGKMLASSYWDHTVRLWEVDSSQCLRTLQGHTQAVSPVAFSPDGKTLASGSYDQTVRLWEVSSGQCLRILHGHSYRVYSIAFSPDGKTLASGGYDQTVRLWEVSSGQCLHILHGHSHWINSVAFSPDGKILASGSDDQTVRLWEVSSGICLHILQGHGYVIWSVAFSPDGKMLASGSADRTVRLWEVSNGQCLSLLQGHTQAARSVAFSPDGKMLASSSADRTVRLWEVSSGQCLSLLQGHTRVIHSVAFSPDGKTLASGGYDRTVRLWEVSSGQCLHTLKCDRPYERMNITRVKGLTEAQKATLKLLGAIEDE